MEIQQYIQRLKEFYNLLLTYIDDENESDDDYTNLKEYYNSEDTPEGREKLNQILRILSKVATNHYRHTGALNRIQKYILHLSSDIKRTYSNLEIFNIFKYDKLILLFLIENKIMSFDQSIVETMLEFNRTYGYFFYPEIESFLTSEQKQSFKMSQEVLNNFEDKRHNGENESYLCSLIRTDSVEEFISYITNKNYPLSSKITSSLFETNSYLIYEEPELIEYASFFGAIQIFQYLILNNVNLKSSLWCYVIHSNNPEMIHILENNKVKMENNNYDKSIEEAVKCHHNNIVNYLKLKEEEEDKNMNNDAALEKLSDRLNRYCLHYDNFEFLSDDLDDKFLIDYIQYHYNEIIKILVKDKKVDVNMKLIFI